MQTTILPIKPRPGLGDIFTTFFILGIQSFGGGSSTFYLIHQTCLRRSWMDDETFLRNWALSQISPGINLVKLTVLIGYHLRGWPGLAAAMAGLLLPSGTATALMTAGFAAIRSQPLVQAALKGVLPATIGLSLAMAFQMGQPLFARAYREGSLRLGIHIIILVGAAILMGANTLSPVVVLLLAGVVTMAALAFLPVKSKPAAEKTPS